MRSRFRLKNRRGSVLVWFGLSVTAIMMLTAIAIDFGMFYVGTAELQTASDAAALRGARRLQVSPANTLADLEADVEAAVTEMNGANRAQGSGVTFTAADVRLARWTSAASPSDPPPEPDFNVVFGDKARHPNAVVVFANKTGNNFFGKIFDGAAPNLRRGGVAWVANLTGTKCLRPWGFPMDEVRRMLTGEDENYTALSQPEIADFGQLSEAQRTIVLQPYPQDWPNKYTPPTGYGLETNPPTWAAARYEAGNNQGMDEFRRLSAGGCLTTEPFSVGDPVTTNFPAPVGSEVADMVSDGMTTGQNNLPKTCYYNTGTADCFATASAITPGVRVRVAYLNKITGSGTNQGATAMMLGEFVLTCMFHGKNEQEAAAQTCQNIPGVKGFTRGTMVGVIQPVFSFRLAPEDELGNTPSLAQKLILVR